MAPAHTRKRNSEAMGVDIQIITPVGSPARKKMKITQSQKQALIDNLQLEITERARGLRAHYALQCADLRARIERRINRIPMALRRAKMGELLEKYSVPAQPKAINSIITASPTKFGASGITIQDRPLPSIPHSPTSKLPSPVRHVQQPLSSTPRGKKRKTSEIVISVDKESETEHQKAEEDNLAVYKNPKRAKIIVAGGGGARNISRSNKPGNVLSPKSHNSRTLPQSPIKDHKPAPSSPSKPSYIARPVSPLKPASPLKTAASAATSAISASFHGMMEHAKRGNAAARTTSREKHGKMLPPPRPGTARSASAQSSSSASSGMSNTTTVVKKGTGLRAATKPNAVVPKTAMKSTSATAVNAHGKKVVVAEPAAGRRVLRKRN